MSKEEFKVLFEKHFDSVRNYIYYRSGNTEMATDVAQETFMTLWEKKFTLESIKSKGLLYKIAGNIFVSNYRKIQVSNNYILSLKLNNEETVENNIEYKELKERYENVLGKMQENQRIVFLMHRIDELKYHEIAEKLNLSVKAVEKRMKKALDYLKKELKDNEQ